MEIHNLKVTWKTGRVEHLTFSTHEEEFAWMLANLFGRSDWHSREQWISFK